MATIPQFYGDLTFSGDSSLFLNNLNGLADDEPFFGGSVEFPDSNSMLSNCPTGCDDYYRAFNMHPADISQVSVTPLQERFGISDMKPPEYDKKYNGDKNIGVCGDVNAMQYFYNGDSSPEQFKPLFCPTIGDHNWGISGVKRIPATEKTNSKVGKYSAEERRDRIMRYLKKKNQRNFNKTIKYVCRKTLADRRVRIRGRFARNNETCKQPPTSTITNIDTKKEEEVYSGDDHHLVQIEHDDRWLQEAISDLMHFPYDIRT